MELQLPNIRPLSYNEVNPELYGMQQGQQMGANAISGYKNMAQARYAPQMAQSEAFLKEQQARNYPLQSLLQYLQSPTVAAAYIANAAGVRGTVDKLRQQAEGLLGTGNVQMSPGSAGSAGSQVSDSDVQTPQTSNDQSPGFFSGIESGLGNGIKAFHDMLSDHLGNIFKSSSQDGQSNQEPKKYYQPSGNNDNGDFTDLDRLVPVYIPGKGKKFVRMRDVSAINEEIANQRKKQNG